MIEYLQSVTGAKLDMKRDVGTVMMTGSPEAVQAAQELVLSAEDFHIELLELLPLAAHELVLGAEGSPLELLPP